MVSLGSRTGDETGMMVRLEVGGCAPRGELPPSRQGGPARETVHLVLRRPDNPASSPSINTGRLPQRDRLREAVAPDFAIERALTMHSITAHHSCNRGHLPEWAVVSPGRYSTGSRRHTACPLRESGQPDSLPGGREGSSRSAACGTRYRGGATAAGGDTVLVLDERRVMRRGGTEWQLRAPRSAETPTGLVSARPQNVALRLLTPASAEDTWQLDRLAPNTWAWSVTDRGTAATGGPRVLSQWRHRAIRPSVDVWRLLATSCAPSGSCCRSSFALARCWRPAPACGSEGAGGCCPDMRSPLCRVR